MTVGPTYETKMIEPEVFQTGVFFSKADLFSPVVFYPEYLSLDSTFQTLQESSNLRQKVFQNWLSVAGPMSVGQYSLLHQCKVAVLARCDVFLRTATDEEVKADYESFGEQVTLRSEKDDSENKDKLPVIPFLGLKLYYTGPARMVMAIFSARVIHDLDVDEVATRFMGEVDEMAVQQINANSSSKSANEGYFLLEAENGKMHYTGFKDVSDFSPFKKWFLGDLKMEGGRLIFLPAGVQNSPIDFSANLYRT